MVLLGVSVGSSRKVLMLALFVIAAAMLWNEGSRRLSLRRGMALVAGSAGLLRRGAEFQRRRQLDRADEQDGVVRCDEAAWRFLGLSLAGYNVLISLTLAVIALWGVAAAWKSRPFEA